MENLRIMQALFPDDKMMRYHKMRSDDIAPIASCTSYKQALEPHAQSARSQVSACRVVHCDENRAASGHCNHPGIIPIPNHAPHAVFRETPHNSKLHAGGASLTLPLLGCGSQKAQEAATATRNKHRLAHNRSGAPTSRMRG